MPLQDTWLLIDERLVLMLCTEGLHIHGYWFRHSDGIWLRCPDIQLSGTMLSVNAGKQSSRLKKKLRKYPKKKRRIRTIQFPNEQQLKVLRERYPAGTLIRLIDMNDPYAPVPPGTAGEVSYIDDAGNIHMVWENGRTLSLIESVDVFEVISDCPGGSEK